MATPAWKPTAAGVKQVNTIVIAGTVTATQTVTLTINNKALVITIGAAPTLATVAADIANAWNASSRLDGTGATGSTSNFGGGEYGEFLEMIAASNGVDTVTLTGATAGKPVTLSIAETLTGTATLATVQSATGPNHFDNAKNWDTGSVPVDLDSSIYRNSSVDCKYGLPNGTLSIQVIHYNSMTGNIGLFPINADNPSKPYPEYRARHVLLDDHAGGSTGLAHQFGIGDGAGSKLINVACSCAAANPNDVNYSATVYSTGQATVAGVAPLNLSINLAVPLAAQINILAGTVRTGRQFGVGCNVPTINIGSPGAASAAVVSLENYTGTSFLLNMYGGNVNQSDDGSVSISRGGTWNIRGGNLVIEDMRDAGGNNFVVTNANVIYNASRTIASLSAGSAGVFDLSQGTKAVTITTCDLFEGATLKDPFARGTYTAGVDLNECGLSDVTLDVSVNRRLTLGTAA